MNTEFLLPGHGDRPERRMGDSRVGTKSARRNRATVLL